MESKLVVRLQNCYGNKPLVYPVCETAKKLAALIGTVTFTARAVSQLRDLGYEFEVESQSL
jgi:hypothetical protein